MLDKMNSTEDLCEIRDSETQNLQDSAIKSKKNLIKGNSIEISQSEIQLIKPQNSERSKDMIRLKVY